MPVKTDLRRLIVPGGCALLTVAILAPVLPRGFILGYDMSFVPRQSLLPDSLGLGSGMPRAVPADALVAVLTTVIPGDILQKLILFATVFLAALGAARLVPTESVLIRLVAAVAYSWNAFLAERLLIGQWGLLVAYAALPWIVKTAREVRDKRDWARLVLVSLPAVITPTGGLLAAGAALAAAGWRRSVGVAAAMAVLNAPWWVPSLLHPGATSDPAAVTAFAARGESWGGPVLSVLGLGGIWNAQVAPASRDNPVLPIFTLLIVGVAIWGLRELHRRWGSWALTGLAGIGLVLALAGSLPGLASALQWAVAHVPAAGLLRDGQKWAAWWALALALGFALGAESLARLTGDRLSPDRPTPDQPSTDRPTPDRPSSDRLSGERLAGSRLARGAIVVGALLLPIVILPDLAWGAAGRLEPVRYPRDWQAVSSILAHDDRAGDVLTAPLSAYRRFSWNADRTQYDPALRYLPRTVVVADSLKVGPTLVRGEDPRAAAVTAAANQGKPLGPYGIGWVLVERGTPGPAIDVGRLHPVYQGKWLTLYRVPSHVTPGAGWPPATPWVLLADAIAVLLGLVSGVALLLPFGRFVKSRRKDMPGG